MEILLTDALITPWRTAYYKNMNDFYIYIIKCKANGKVYVGRTHNPRHRFRTHATSLRGGRHCNKRLQEDFNKYGESQFFFQIVHVTPERFDQAEQAHMWLYRSYDPAYGYNDDLGAKTMRRRMHISE